MTALLFDDQGRLSRETLDELEQILVREPVLLEQFVDGLAAIADDARREGRW